MGCGEGSQYIGVGGQEAIRVRADGSELRFLLISPWKQDVGVLLLSKEVLHGVSCMSPDVAGAARSRVLRNEVESVIAPMPGHSVSGGLRPGRPGKLPSIQPREDLHGLMSAAPRTENLRFTSMETDVLKKRKPLAGLAWVMELAEGSGLRLLAVAFSTLYRKWGQHS